MKAPLHDAARALQFVRSKAAEWNIDKAAHRRLAAARPARAPACGSRFTTTWPTRRAATRSRANPRGCGAPRSTGAQTTLDPQQMKEWTPNSRYGGHAFGFMATRRRSSSQFDEFLAEREKILPWIAEYSPYALVTADDPPDLPDLLRLRPRSARTQKDPTHTANFGVKLQEHCKAIGVACELVYPGAPDVKHATSTAYLIATLKTTRRRERGGPLLLAPYHDLGYSCHDENHLRSRFPANA